METKNWITGYAPVNVNLQHLANTFEEKQRDLRHREKQYLISQLDAQFYKIKKRSHYTFFNVIPESYYSQMCNVCFRNEKVTSTDNYYVNLLDCNQLFSLRNTRTKYFKRFRFFFTSNTYSIDCSSKLLQNTELFEFLDASAAYYEKNKTMYSKKPITFGILFSLVKKAVKSFTYTFSSLTFRILGVCWYAVSRTFVQRLIVSSVEIENLKKANQNDRSLVYVLRNQSKFDWFITLFVLFFCKLRIPVIFLRKGSSSRLNWLYRKLGVVFMPPYKTHTNFKNNVYMEAWLMYIEDNLKLGNHLLIYLDGREDDMFVLETIVDSIKRSLVEDILITPVSINYERKVDKFTNEKMLGGSRWTQFINVFGRKMYNFGFVNVTFNQPFSLKKLITSLGNELNANDATLEMISHLNFDFCRSQVLLPTNLICFFLLKKFRDGVKFDDLVREVDEFYSELKSLKKRVGFTGRAHNVVSHVIKLLGPTLIVVDSSNVKPVLTLPHVLELADYADGVLHHFMMDAIIMTAVAILFKDELEDAFKESDRELKFYYLELFEKSEKLCEILQFEYVFEKPCRKFIDELDGVLCRFVNNNYFIKFEKMLTEEEQWGNRLARHLEESDSEESDTDDSSYSPAFQRPAKDMGDMYTVNLNNDKPVLREILFYKNIIKSLLDTYVISAQNLNTLVGKQKTDSAYYKKLLDKMKIMLNEKQLQYSESVSLNVLKNSMKLFEKWGVVERYYIDGIEVFYLSSYYDVEDKLVPIIKKISMFQ